MINRLVGIPGLLRVAFAGLCAERLLPAYVRLSTEARMGNPGEFAGILDRLWTDIEAGAVAPADSQIERAMALVPGEGDVPWVKSQAAGEDAGKPSATLFDAARRETAKTPHGLRNVYARLSTVSSSKSSSST
jgi:uncharacterized protein YjaG (DUF416 family)